MTSRGLERTWICTGSSGANGLIELKYESKYVKICIYYLNHGKKKLIVKARSSQLWTKLEYLHEKKALEINMVCIILKRS